MIPPFLVRLAHEPEDYIAVYSRLYRGNSHALPLSPTELEQQLIDLFRLLSGDSCARASCYGVLSQIVLNERSNDNDAHFHILAKVFNGVIDRLAGLFESIASTDEGKQAITMLDAILSSGAEQLITSISRAIPRITQAACRLCNNKPELLEYGLSILHVILTSDQRNLAFPQSAAIKQLCFAGIYRPDVFPTAPLVLSLIHAIDTAENWMESFKIYCESAIVLVRSLGMSVRYELPAAPQTYALVAGLPVDLQGSKKAIAYERCLKGISITLKQMLVDGCAAGPLRIDCGPLLALASSILTLQIKVASHDPKAIVDNDHGVSLLDITLVATQLKMHILGILQTLLEQRASVLLRISSHICRSIAALLSSTDVRELPEVAQLALQCLALEARVFPTVIAKNLNLGVDALVDMLQKEVNSVTISKADIVTEELAKQVVRFGHGTQSRATAAGPLVVVTTCEAVMLHCGAMLPTATREVIELALAQLLDCICRGVLLPQVPDRKLKRSSCEGIRQDPPLQRAVLSLAVVEVMTSSRTGVMSGNVGLLKRAATCCLAQAETSAEATKALLVVDALLHPSTFPLPSVPPLVLAKNFLAKCAEAATTVGAAATEQMDSVIANEITKATNASNTGASSGNNSSNIVVSVSAVTEHNGTTAAPDENENQSTSFGIIKKRKPEEVAEGTDKTIKKPAVIVSSNAAAPPQQTPKAPSANTPLETKRNPLDGDDSDNDSLPDIDVEAEPDV